MPIFSSAIWLYGRLCFLGVAIPDMQIAVLFLKELFPELFLQESYILTL